MYLEPILDTLRTATKTKATRVQHTPMDVRLLIPPAALRCAVPAHVSGLGGGPKGLSPLIRRLCEASESAALLLWAQRMAIEFFCCQTY